MYVLSDFVALLKEALEGLEIDILCVNLLTKKKGRKTLQIIIDRHDRSMVTLDNCEIVNDLALPLLEIHEFDFGKNFDLEVSSPGIDRPLTTLSDYNFYKGFDVKLVIDQEGELKNVTGVLKDVCDDTVILSFHDKDRDDCVFNFSIIQKAKLVLTKRLVEFSKSNIKN